MGNAKFNVLDASRLFFPWLFKGLFIKGKIIIIEMIWGENKNYFELWEVWVIEGSSYWG